MAQRVLEANGIATVGISIEKKFTEEVKPPRTVFLKWPYGHPLGEPGAIKQQRAVLDVAFRMLETCETPGEIIEPGYAWKRHKYE